MGRKKGYKTITALCGVRPNEDGTIYGGCHAFHDTNFAAFKLRFPDFDGQREARRTERAWRKFTAGRETA